MTPSSSVLPASPLPSGLPPAGEARVRAGLLTEMFVRTREAAPLGLLPVALLVWAHVDIINFPAVALWLGMICAAGFARWQLAGVFLRRPRVGVQEVSRWQRFELAATIAVAAAWGSSLWLMDTGGVDGYFYLKLIVLVALAGFTQSTQGMVPAVFAAFLIVFAGMLVVYLATLPTPLERQVMLLQVGILIYATVLMMRSQVEYLRVRQWIEARFAQEALVARLNELASRDTLTGAFSRAHVQHALRGFSSIQRRDGMAYSVLMLDIDRFKSINDAHGHAAGDEVLRRMTEAAIAELRPTDLFGRWGGEEFIAVLPRTCCAAALETAERLRRRTERLHFDAVATGLHVTVSIGVAEAAPSEVVDAVILRADDALYDAKRQGRNRAVAAPVPRLAVPRPVSIDCPGAG